ncbi:MAG: hypothetical protein ACD_82C00148G0001 [uncultured bacterium]|nr:MAG: hypothetical protein ACD_82C00148G0001 [uncultured bacterium]
MKTHKRATKLNIKHAKIKIIGALVANPKVAAVRYSGPQILPI